MEKRPKLCTCQTIESSSRAEGTTFFNRSNNMLGIQPTTNKLTMQETWDELVARLSYLFTNEFLSTSHPLIGHFRVAVQREGDFYGFVPVSVIAAYDVKLNNLCKFINQKAETNPPLSIALILKAARLSSSICTSEGKLWIWKQNPLSPEIIHSDLKESIQIKAMRIPCSMEKPVETLTLNVSSKEYYLDVIAQKLGVGDCSQVIISRTVSKASSEMRLYFSAPKDLYLTSDSSLEVLSNMKETVNSQSLFNARAHYFSGQNIYGDALLATVGYTWKSTDLFHEDVSLATYYRMLICRVPDGNYKLSREAIVAAELPTAFTTRSNWRGSFPRELLCMFCRQHRLSEPIFSTEKINPSEPPLEISKNCQKLKLSESTSETEHANRGTGDANDGELRGQGTFKYEVRILSKEQDVIIECSSEDSYRRHSDAYQSVALKVLTWLNKYFKELDMPIEKLSCFGVDYGIRVNPQILSGVFALCPFVHNVQQTSVFRKCSSLGASVSAGDSNPKESVVPLFNIEGPDTGMSPSSGSLTCISYSISLVRGMEYIGEPLESKDEFEFEIGAGAINQQLETCVTQMSLDQSARFTTELPSRDLILGASGESAEALSLQTLQGCFLEYSVKVLRVTEPLEDRMEQALFSPPLSKQRVEYAVRLINESHATTLVDFGCGSGSLLDSLLEHPTALEKIVGVDISWKSLCRAAKILHSKLSMDSDPKVQSKRISSAILYDGSITDFDARLFGFDIGTCLEVIEHMEEDQASLFGDVVLSSFCPQILIVSTPNYEYNPILQRGTSPNKEDDLEEKTQSLPFKFRNHDHKFEWTREQFNSWASNLASRYNYSVEFDGVGGSPGVEPGFASQIAVFRKNTIQADCLRDGKAAGHYEVLWEWTSNTSRSAL
ncbi:small RNA 2'-O-methyltransferase isoform X2 [Magnolia sinica]|uniref:small RNA 2'-O-methyltransferase isoform X2 n=1 Tax=Magnolia sinica TaxID=86752 RepID=UPI00265AA64A|nr:small RNA 2'-O-methyltransferase isoform X2 [Magnolia sinica]XP_058100053.1 small RNA 2'-O-methyltransferase isoform X2 [Magnolia sinica]